MNENTPDKLYVIKAKIWHDPNDETSTEVVETTAGSLDEAGADLDRGIVGGGDPFPRIEILFFGVAVRSEEKDDAIIAALKRGFDGRRALKASRVTREKELRAAYHETRRAWDDAYTAFDTYVNAVAAGSGAYEGDRMLTLITRRAAAYEAYLAAEKVLDAFLAEDV